MIDRQRRCRRFEPRQRAERYLSTRDAERHLGAERRLSTRAADSRLSARAAERRLSAGSGAQVNVLQILQSILEMRFDFQYYPILVRLREYGRDLALAKGVIQHIIDRLYTDAEAGRCIAVDDQARLQAQVLVVAGDIMQLRQLLQLLHKAWCPEAQLFGIGRFETVLILRTADTILDGQVLHRLHEKGNAFHIDQGQLQAADDVAGTDMPLLERLQVNLDTPAVEGRIGAIDTDEGRQTLDCRVLQNHPGEGLLALSYGLERYRLRRLGNAQDNTGILHGKEALGHDDVQPYRGHERSNGDHERRDPVAQYPAQRQAIEGDDAVEDTLRGTIKPALLRLRLVAQHAGTHHRRQCQGDDRRHQNGNAQRHGKFAEQPTDDVAHEQQRDQHGNQRHREGEDGKANLFGAFERG